MNWSAALFHGFIWSLMWGIPICVIEYYWPQVFAHDYPPEIQKISQIPPLAGKQKTSAYVVTITWMVLVLAFLFWSVISTHSAVPVSYWILYLHTLVLCFSWILFDLIVMDWGIFCYFTPKFIILPGTEGHPAYKDYRFHFIGFLKGIGIMLVLSLPLSGICWLILNNFYWWIPICR